MVLMMLNPLAADLNMDCEALDAGKWPADWGAIVVADVLRDIAGGSGRGKSRSGTPVLASQTVTLAASRDEHKQAAVLSLNFYFSLLCGIPFGTKSEPPRRVSGRNHIAKRKRGGTDESLAPHRAISRGV